MASLVDLPTELLSRIASHLFHPDQGSCLKFADDGFCNLRLSCRCVEVRTRYAFKKAAFSTATATLHPRSLLRLRNVFNHSDFGKSIRKLVFLKARHPIYDESVAPVDFERTERQHQYASYGVIELPKDGADGVYPNEGLSLRKRVRLGLQDYLTIITALATNLEELVIEPNFMASFWLDSPSRQEQLDEQVLRNYRLAFESRARHYDERDFRSEESNESEVELDIMDNENENYDNDDYDDPFHLEAYVYPDYLFYLIAKSVHQQGVRLSSISSSNPNASSVRTRTFVEFAPTLQNLQYLNISVNVSSATKLRRMNGSPLRCHQNGQHTAASFGLALSTLQNLKSLELAFDNYYWEDDRNSNISESLHGLGAVKFEYLTNIDIQLASFEGQDLYEFLHNQRSTIQQLVLCRITLTSIAHWKSILAVLLGETLLLTKVRCSELTGGTDSGDTLELSNRTEGWGGCCTVDCSNREETLVGLRKALRNLTSAMAQD